MIDAEWLQELRGRCRDEATFHQIRSLLQDGHDAEHRSTDVDVPKHQDYRLFIRAIERIRHSLNCSDILQAAVREVLAYLSLDRVMIVQFETSLSARFVAEAIEDDNDLSVLATPEQTNAAFLIAENVSGVTASQCRFDLSSALECTLIEQLQRFDVRSIAVTPIFCSDLSWGALVACYHNPRPVSFRIRELLQQFGLSIGSALDHADLLEQTQIKTRKLATTLRTLQKTQTQLIQSEKMASLGQLVAGIAHEINNPVNFIYGNISYIRDYTEDLMAIVEAYQAQFSDTVNPLAKEIEELELDFIRQDLPRLVSSMHNGTTRIRQIVQSLRTFSRHDEAESKRIDIHSGIDSVILLLRHRFEAVDLHREILVERNYADLPPIHCYPAALNQVFINLLTNAIDALADRTDIDPKISITTARLDPDYISITIRDNGIGILPEHQPRIFDPFFTTKPPGKGTGLGLSVSYQIVVETHEGELTCESVPNEGCTLTIELPIHADLA
ncbi:MAG: GAF domain-containing protein [Coleofasciculaceae cyanobacterium RL_1_1]|nr:GAF domain-containing protein [Coleofasciculaceae cyanobacterium RL_1_1]